MKKTLTVCILVLLGLLGFTLLSTAQEGPVVTSAAFLEWDYEDGLEGTIQGFRVYMSPIPNIIPDGVNYAVEVSYPTKEWPIQGGVGQWYAVVTAVAVSGAESGPSNEVAFYILEAPGNLRIRQ